MDTGFHPLDGARYLERLAPALPEASTLAALVAHHTGAVFEAQQRGLGADLGRYRFPVDVIDLAILNCADLCTSPHGNPVDPIARLAEVLDRYPCGHPVHQAITISAPLLAAQAQLVLDAAECGLLP